MAAATLSSGTATVTGRHTATLAVTSNQASGTVYAVVTESSTAPSHAQILAGQDNSGNAAEWAGSATAALSNTFYATALASLPGKYYAHFSQVNAGAEASTPVSSAGFKPTPSSYGTLTANGDTDEVTLAYPFLRLSGDFGTGTLTWKYKAGNGDWIAIDGGALTAADQIVAEFHRPVTVRGTLAGATNPDLDWEIR